DRTGGCASRHGDVDETKCRGVGDHLVKQAVDVDRDDIDVERTQPSLQRRIEQARERGKRRGGFGVPASSSSICVDSGRCGAPGGVSGEGWVTCWPPWA